MTAPRPESACPTCGSTNIGLDEHFAEKAQRLRAAGYDQRVKSPRNGVTIEEWRARKKLT